MKIEPFVKEVLEKYDFDETAMWDCHGTAVIYHKVLEQIATKAGIIFDQPFVCSAEPDNIAVCVTGSAQVEMKIVGRAAKLEMEMVEERTEWSIGEAAPKNNKNSYPWAMAEKRAKDRVILKLIGLHGFVYSEQEADEFKEERPDNVKGSVVKAKKAFKTFFEEVAACEDTDQLDAFLIASKPLIERFLIVIPEYMAGGGDVPSYEDRINQQRINISNAKFEKEQ